MDCSELEDMTLSVGAGSRRDECLICAEEIQKSEPSVSHDSCKNTFHKSCLDQWADHNCRQFRNATCPMCREHLGGPFDLRITYALDHITPEIEMLDFELRRPDIQSSPVLSDGLVLFWHTNRYAAQTWLLDYFVRACRRQDISNCDGSRTLARILASLQALDLNTAMHQVAGETRPGDVRITDFDILNLEGQRRPREYAVRRYELSPEVAGRVFRAKVRSMARFLGISELTQSLFMARFEKMVFEEILRRHEASQPAAGPPQPATGPPESATGPPESATGPSQPATGPSQPTTDPSQPAAGPSQPATGSPSSTNTIT